MKLSISIAARDRLFAKAFRRVRSNLDQLSEEFSAIAMDNPIHEAVLIGLTDEKNSAYFDILPNHDGFFQVLAGVDWPATDAELQIRALEVIGEAIACCPFSKPDLEKFSELLAGNR